MDEKETFLEYLGVYCKLKTKTNFIIEGTVISVLDSGITFRSSQATAFLAFSEIAQLTPKVS
jgi:hypothetical protein